MILSAWPCGLPDRGLFRRYTFPDNCYSETIASHPDIMASMAKAHGMIGKAEPLLYVPTPPRLRSLRVDRGLSQAFRPTESCCVGDRYPAERVKSAVGILYPRSSAYWDLRNVAVPTALMDCTNSNMDSGTMDYFAEVPTTSGALLSVIDLAAL